MFVVRQGQRNRDRQFKSPSGGGGRYSVYRLSPVRVVVADLDDDEKASLKAELKALLKALG